MIELDENFCDVLYKKYDSALNGKHLIFNGESAIQERITSASLGSGYSFELTELPSLQQRPEVGTVKENPFANPEPELTIVDKIGISGEFKIVFNKFPVVPAHFMMVTREFKSQDTPLSPSELVSIFSILRNLKTHDSKEEWFAFYNCGPHSGASQPHKHIQFMRQPHDFKAFAENLANSGQHFIPSQYQEPLQDPKMPFAHYLAKLPDNYEDLDEETLALLFVSLLQRVLTVLKQKEAGHISYNFLATTKYMMLVPRSAGKFKNELGINSCGFMGLFLCKNAHLVDLVKSEGPENILGAVGFPNTAGETSDEYHY